MQCESHDGRARSIALGPGSETSLHLIRSSLAIWIAVFTLATVRGLYHVTKRVAPQLHGKISSASVGPRSALLHAPLFRSRHHEAYPLIKVGSTRLLSVRAPLRSQTLLVGVLILANLLGFVVGFKDVVE